MKMLRVTVRGSTFVFEAAQFFDRFAPGRSPNTLTISADVIDSVEIVDQTAGIEVEGESEIRNLMHLSEAAEADEKALAAEKAKGDPEPELDLSGTPSDTAAEPENG